MWKAVLLAGLWIIFVLSRSAAQGVGGGVWLEDGATCIGSLIYKNQATDGFGVAGGNGVLLNSTLSQNSRLAVEVHYPQPGDIFCSNGDIVDRETYKTRTTKDAIGIVFWLNGDPEVKYPKGAVISLDGQKKCSWGTIGVSDCWLMQGMVDLGIAHPYRKDTACYRNTSILEEFWDMYGDDFEAGHHCWNYKAYFQTHNPNDKTKNIRWVLPTLKYLSNLMAVLPKVIPSLEVVGQTTSGLSVDDFICAEDQEREAFYWSSCDGGSADTWECVWVVNFYNGECLNDFRSNRDMQHWARPIFLY